jgi:magnesium-transporting ATPase (P-type)
MVNNFDFLWFLLTILPILLIWDLFWRGTGLWKSATNGQKYWFVALLLVNSLGILPIIYLKFFQKHAKKINQK